MSDTLTTPDYTAIKQRQQAAWSSGDYSRIGVTLQIVGETLAEALDLPAGATALDVAAGNGNATLALARRGVDVVSTDYVESLLDRGRARAEAEGLPAVFQVADAEELPFADGAFDAVVSTFGVMFAPDQENAAAELVRVCRSGGRIGLGELDAGQLHRRGLPPDRTLPPAARRREAAVALGRPDVDRGEVRALGRVALARGRQFVFRYASPQEALDELRRFYGPILKAFAALDAEGQEALERDFLAVIDRFNTAADGTMRVPSDYAEIVITKA